MAVLFVVNTVFNYLIAHWLLFMFIPSFQTSRYANVCCQIKQISVWDSIFRKSLAQRKNKWFSHAWEMAVPNTKVV